MRFEFATATRIIFGAGTLREVGSIAAEMGHRALVVTGRSTERAGPLLDILSDEGLQCAIFSVTGEPTTDLARRGTGKRLGRWRGDGVVKDHGVAAGPRESVHRQAVVPGDTVP